VAFVFGSIAGGEENADSDVDLPVIGEMGFRNLSEINSEDIDFRAASEFLEAVSRRLTPPACNPLGLTFRQGDKEIPTYEVVLLFGKNRHCLFPDAVIRCARFHGVDSKRFLDKMDLDEYLPRAVEPVIAFVERHTLQGAEIGRIHRMERSESLI